MNKEKLRNKAQSIIEIAESKVLENSDFGQRYIETNERPLDGEAYRELEDKIMDILKGL